MKPSKKNMTYNSSARGRVWSLHIEGMPSAVFKDGKKPLLQANIAGRKHLKRGELKAMQESVMFRKSVPDFPIFDFLVGTEEPKAIKRYYSDEITKTACMSLATMMDLSGAP
jgi:hypothetical protein